MSRPLAKWIRVSGGTRRRRVPNPTVHSTVWRSSVIRFTLRVADGSMLHVGSGMVSVHNGRPLILHSRSAKGYVIPGSTLKGAVAHYFTALYRDIGKTSSLFGWPGYMSRALFSDAVTDSNPSPWGVDPSWKPRIGERSSIKLYDANIRLREVEEPVQYVEAFSPGTEFRGEVVLINPGKNETAELLLAMGVTPEGSHHFLLGFGRPKGMGKVEIVPSSVRVTLLDPLGIGKEVTGEALSAIGNLHSKYRNNFEEVFGVGQV